MVHMCFIMFSFREIQKTPILPSNLVDTCFLVLNFSTIQMKR